MKHLKAYNTMQDFGQDQGNEAGYWYEVQEWENGGPCQTTVYDWQDTGYTGCTLYHPGHMDSIVPGVGYVRNPQTVMYNDPGNASPLLDLSNFNFYSGRVMREPWSNWGITDEKFNYWLRMFDTKKASGDDYLIKIDDGGTPGVETPSKVHISTVRKTNGHNDIEFWLVEQYYAINISMDNRTIDVYYME